MKTNHERLMNRPQGRKTERGNALVYVLIAIALFAALSFTLGRQTDTGEADTISDDKAELLATQIISYAAQVTSVIDQMTITGTDIGNLDFVVPTAAAFNTAPHIDKVYHPEGGGLNPARLPTGSIAQSDTDPVAGWYLGRFNNVEWTATTGTDVILVAYQISQKICENLNEKINGSTTIPSMTNSLKTTLIDDGLYAVGANLDLSTDPASTPICAACHKMSSLCVQSGGIYGFYTVIADR